MKIGKWQTLCSPFPLLLCKKHQPQPFNPVLPSSMLGAELHLCRESAKCWLIPGAEAFSFRDLYLKGRSNISTFLLPCHLSKGNMHVYFLNNFL